MLITWNKKLATGINEVDTQHRSLLSALNRLLSTINAGRPKDEIEETLDFIQDYTHTHFSTEEEYMDKHGYPGALDHKQQHKKFTQNFLEAKDFFDLLGPSISLALRCERILGNWLVNHIANDDVALGSFLSKTIPCKDI